MRNKSASVQLTQGPATKSAVVHSQAPQLVRSTGEREVMATVAARAIQVLGTREKAVTWLRTPLPTLSDRTPGSMLQTPEGIARVEDVLGRIEHGIW